MHSRPFANRDGPAGFGALLEGLKPDQHDALADLVEAELAAAVGPDPAPTRERTPGRSA